MIPHLGTARYGCGVGLPAERESHGHGIRAGWEPDRCQRRRKALQARLFSIRSRGDLRSSWRDGSLAGIRGYDRLCAGIPVRDLRGMKTSRRSCAPNPATKHADLQVLYGSDGTRTATSGVTVRSWRLRAERGLAGIGGYSRAFRPWACGDSGDLRELPAPSCRMSAGCGVAGIVKERYGEIGTSARTRNAADQVGGGSHELGLRKAIRAERLRDSRGRLARAAGARSLVEQEERPTWC